MFSSRPPAAVIPASQAALQHSLRSRFSRQRAPPYYGLPQQRREYVTPAPSVSRRNRSPSNARRGLLFSKHDLPPLSFYETFMSRPWNTISGVTAEDCLNTALHYCSVAADDNTAWKAALQRDHNIDLHMLHWTAISLMGSGVSARASRVGFHMAMTASSLGSTPSTLSLIRFFMHASREKASTTKTLLRDAEARFRRLLQTEKNPDALTLQGLLLFYEGRADAYVLKYFDQAIAAACRQGSPHQRAVDGQAGPAVREPIWDWEGVCRLYRGRILAKQGRTEDALASLKIAALQLDAARGYVELAKLLPRDAPERETYLLKAAQSGQFEACRFLALDMADKAIQPGLTESERAHAARMAHEWALLEPDPNKRQMATAEVAYKVRDVLRGERGFWGKAAGWVLEKLPR